MDRDRKRRRAASNPRQPTDTPPPAPKHPRRAAEEEEHEAPLPAPVRPPDTAAFFKRISTAAKAAAAQESAHQGYQYSAGLNARFQKTLQPWAADAEDNRVKAGHLSSADYEDGYLSDEGDTFLKAIHARKNATAGGVDTLKSGKKSRSGRPIKLGEDSTVRYRGVDVHYRVDFTEVPDKPEGEQDAPTTHWEPHARLYAFGKDASTKDLGRFAGHIGVHGSETEKQHFVAGVTGQPPPAQPISAAFATGVEFRAIGRASDAFGQVFPALDGLLLAKPQSPQGVQNLFFNPTFETGALGHQNHGQGATTDFNSYKEIVAGARTTHTTKKGTDIDTVSLVRKARAINALVPAETPIVDLTTRPKSK